MQQGTKAEPSPPAHAAYTAPTLHNAFHTLPHTYITTCIYLPCVCACLQVEDEAVRLLGLQIALKIADIGHVCRPIFIASHVLESLEEVRLQGCSGRRMASALQSECADVCVPPAAGSMQQRLD